MKVITKYSKDNLTIYLDGELDNSCVNMVREKSDESIHKNPNIKNLTYDFSKLSFMDSTGIGMLLGRYKKLKRYGIPMTIANPNLQVMKAIKITGLDEIINIK